MNYDPYSLPYDAGIRHMMQAYVHIFNMNHTCHLFYKHILLTSSDPCLEKCRFSCGVTNCVSWYKFNIRQRDYTPTC